MTEKGSEKLPVNNEIIRSPARWASSCSEASHNTNDVISPTEASNSDSLNTLRAYQPRPAIHEHSRDHNHPRSPHFSAQEPTTPEFCEVATTAFPAVYRRVISDTANHSQSPRRSSCIQLRNAVAAPPGPGTDLHADPAIDNKSSHHGHMAMIPPAR
ncbi:hypothetical protein EK21DRAFT_87625 [Setomelanomma holmii]|uniref:Uncharacterized protein n=1 Tax=Setomelanomma holmii TaxID=210430 RepID=A0A9P4HCB6_9PLEO|nr:hypothetical protein EK21DRAFT_87625 [Setomelanomma holmii]